MSSPSAEAAPLLLLQKGIMCSLEGSMNQLEDLTELMRHGLSVARIDYDSTTAAEIRELMSGIRAAESALRQEQGFPAHVAIALDLKSEGGSLEESKWQEVHSLVAAGVDMIVVSSEEAARELRQRFASKDPVPHLLLEISDAKAVQESALDVVDGVLVSDKTAAADPLVRLCKSRAKPVIRSSERHLDADCILLSVASVGVFKEMRPHLQSSHSSVPAAASVDLDTDNPPKAAHILGALNVSLNRESVKAIVVMDESGKTVRRLVSMRPTCHVVAVVGSERLARQMRLLQQVVPLVYEGDWGVSDWRIEKDERVKAATLFLKECALAKEGDDVVVLTDGKSTGVRMSCVLQV